MDLKQVMTGSQPEAPQSQNLVNPVKIDPISRTERVRFYKFLGFSILAVLSAFVLGLSYARYLGGAVSFWLVLVATFVFSIFGALQVLLPVKPRQCATVILLETAALLIPFYDFDWRALSILGVMLLVFLLWGYFESRSELGYAIRIRFFKVTHGAVGKLATGILLFGIFSYALAPGGTGNVFLGQSSFSGLFNAASGLLTNLYPMISTTGSFSSFAQSIAQAQLNNNVAFQAENPADQAKSLDQATDQITQNFTKSLNVAITPSSTTSGVIYSFITNTLRNWQSRSPEWFLAGWSIVVFLVLRSIGIVFILISQFLALIVYESLVTWGFFRTKEQPETRETVDW